MSFIEGAAAMAILILSIVIAVAAAVLLLAKFCLNRARIPQNANHAEDLDLDVDAGLACELAFDLPRPCDITKVLEDHEGSDDDAADLPAIDELPGDLLLEADGPGAIF